jgi:hypothetical protein
MAANPHRGDVGGGRLVSPVRVKHRVAKTFTEETVLIDEGSFEQCRFVACTIVYSGGVVSLKDNEFDSCTWTLDGAAARTVKFLELVYGLGESGRGLVDRSFESIKRGPALP